jgi:hypothetical protein
MAVASIGLGMLLIDGIALAEGVAFGGGPRGADDRRGAAHSADAAAHQVAPRPGPADRHHRNVQESPLQTQFDGVVLSSHQRSSRS